MGEDERLLHAAQRLATAEAEPADALALREAHPADVAHVLQHLDAGERQVLFRSLGVERAGDVLSELDDHTLLELIRDAHLPADGGVPRLDAWVEPVDPVWYTASAAKQSGLLAEARIALHIEMPRAARTAYREFYTEVLADFLLQSVGMLLASGR